MTNKKNKKSIVGFLFNRMEKLGDQEYKHLGFEDAKKKFGDLIESFVPNLGDKLKVRLTVEVIEDLKKDKKLSLVDLKKILVKVKHPAINSSLIDLGIIKDIKLNSGVIKIIMAFPFPNIPIKDQLITAVKDALKSLKLKVEIETTVMTKTELKKFLALEKKNWAA